VISTNNLACLNTQSVCDKNSQIFLTFSHRFLYIASPVGTVQNWPFWGVFLWDHDVFELFVSVCRPQLHKNTNALLILQVWDVILFYLWKTYNGAPLYVFPALKITSRTCRISSTLIVIYFPCRFFFLTRFHSSISLNFLLNLHLCYLKNVWLYCISWTTLLTPSLW